MNRTVTSREARHLCLKLRVAEAFVHGDERRVRGVCLERAVELDPQRSRSRATLALALRRQGELEAAVEAAQGAIDSEPSCVLVAELERAFGLDRYSQDRW